MPQPPRREPVIRDADVPPPPDTGVAPTVAPAGLWRFIFGNDNPVEIEIGPGTGTFVLANAAVRPQTNFLALENSRSRTLHLQQLAAERALPNLRILLADAACVVGRLIPPESVAAYHVYFPDPWWKRRHHRRRLFGSGFVLALARTLAPGGFLHVATDVEDAFARIVQSLQESGCFRRDPSRRPPRNTQTSFERKALLRGVSVREATFLRIAAPLDAVWEPGGAGGSLQ